MNPSDLAPLTQQSSKHIRNGWTWYYVHPKRILELVNEICALQARMREIHALIEDKSLPAWACNHRDVERALYDEILELTALDNSA